MKFRHSTKIQVRFSDIDSLGHVNHANYLSYMEQARIMYFNDVVKSPVAWKEEGIILAKVVVDYKLPLFLKDDVVVLTRCSRIGNKSFDLEYRIIRQDATESLIATGTTVLVGFDYKNGITVPLPDEWKVAMKDYDNIISE